MYHYSAFNLRISSPIELPWLPPADDGADIIISFAPRDPHAGPPPAMEHAFHVTPRVGLLDYAELGRLTLVEGRELRVALLPHADESRLPEYIMGPALAVLLYQRGLLVLRASAVGIGGAAILFLAGSGGGKSTLAAKLYQRGHELLAEDVAAVDMSGSFPRLIPAPPMLQLDASTAASLSLAQSPARLGRPQPAKGVSLVEQLPAAATPLGAVYALRKGEQNGISFLPLQAGLAAVAHHSYPACLLLPSSRDYLRLCSRLVGAVPVCQFTRRYDLGELAEQAGMLEEHLQAQLQLRGGSSLVG